MLVELLVAMAVGAFLLIALASVTSFLLRVHDRTADAAKENENASRALASLTRDIERALPTRWAGKDAAFVFSGSSAGLLFARLAPGPDGLDEVTVLRLEVARKGAVTRLVRFDGILPPDAAAPDAVAWNPPVPLYSGQSSVAFAYFRRLEGGGEAVLDDWPAGDAMPVAVRVSFLSTLTNGRVLALRIPLLIDTEIACASPDAEKCSGHSGDTESGDDAPGSSVKADDPLGWGRYAR